MYAFVRRIKIDKEQSISKTEFNFVQRLLIISVTTEIQRIVTSVTMDDRIKMQTQKRVMRRSCWHAVNKDTKGKAKSEMVKGENIGGRE